MESSSQQLKFSWSLRKWNQTQNGRCGKIQAEETASAKAPRPKEQQVLEACFQEACMAWGIESER